MSSNQRGFTLIELIVVIVILGILAATALPKFVDLSADARVAVMQGVEGSMRGANAIVYARAVTLGFTATSDGSESVTMPDGSTVALVYGFAQNATQLANAMDLSPAADFPVGTTGTDGDIYHLSGGTTCYVGYTNAAAAGQSPTYNNQATLANCV